MMTAQGYRTTSYADRAFDVPTWVMGLRDRDRPPSIALFDSRLTRSFVAGGGGCRYLVVTLAVATPPLVLRTVMCSGLTAH